MKIGIIGYGVVGKAISETMSKHYEIVKYDKYSNHDKFNELKNCDFLFLSVPTPFDFNKGIVDDSALVESLARLESINYDNLVIIKSTIPPGTSDRYCTQYNLRIVFNPEFLRESQTPNEDFRDQDCVVIGSKNSNDYESVKIMYEKVLSNKAVYYPTTLVEAEMVKYSQNTMLASRVALANMIYDACLSLDVDYQVVKELAFDNFEILGPHMTEVPGPDGKRGFGGKCLPKDIHGFSTIFSSPLLNAIIDYNDSLRDDLNKFLMNYNKK